MLNDLRFALRMLRKSPGFTALAVCTLALAIGGNTAILSLINALFVRPPQVENPQQLVGVYASRDNQPDFFSVSYADYVDYRERNTAFSTLASHSSYRVSLVTNGDSKEESCSIVSGNYFQVLGVKPALGRFFLPAEDVVRGNDPVAVISYRIWQGRFGSNSDIFKDIVRLNGIPFTVIGVAPKEFSGIYAGSPVDVWIPNMAASKLELGCDTFGRQCTWLEMIGRLKPGNTIREARAELTLLSSQLEAAYPETNKGHRLYVAPLRGTHPGQWKGESRLPSLFLATAGCTLLIACANLAGLLLARNLQRRKEIAVRLSVGASRGRLIRQLLTEGLMLAIFGGAAGLLVAFWARDLFMAFYSYYYPTLDLALDPMVLVLSGALSLFAGILLGLAPALQTSRPNLAEALKDGGTTVGGRRSNLRGALVTVQIALSMILLVCAGLLTRSLRNAYLNMGFHPEKIVHMRLGAWKLGADSEAWSSFYQEMLRRLEVLPGVQSVCLGRTIPIGERSGPLPVSLPGSPAARSEDLLQVENNEITSRFFETLGIPLIKGRDFSLLDDRKAPRVVIVNETLARRLWLELDPLGRILIVDGKEHQVVGIARDVHLRSIAEGPLPFLYLCYSQRERVNTRIFLRSSGDPQTLLPLIRKEIMTVYPDISIAEGMLLTNWLQGYFSYVQVLGNVLSCASLQALFISAIGLYGMILLAVNQRTREFGIRKALGARESDVLNLVLREGLGLGLLGTALGVVAAFFLTAVVSNFLYGITPTDPFTFVRLALFLVGLTLTASYFPARRATKVDPMVALRYE